MPRLPFFLLALLICATVVPAFAVDPTENLSSPGSPGAVPPPALFKEGARAKLSTDLVQLVDPAEEALPFSGRVRFEGLEGEGEALFGRVESVREAYGAAIAAHRQGLSALAMSVDWTLAVHHTDQPPEPSLMALFMALSANGR